MWRTNRWAASLLAVVLMYASWAEGAARAAQAVTASERDGSAGNGTMDIGASPPSLGHGHATTGGCRSAIVPVKQAASDPGAGAPEVPAVELERPLPRVVGRRERLVPGVEPDGAEKPVPEARVDGVAELHAPGTQLVGQPPHVLHADALVLVAPEADDRAVDAVHQRERLEDGVRAGRVARAGREPVVADRGTVVPFGCQGEHERAAQAEADGAGPAALDARLGGQPADGHIQVAQDPALVEHGAAGRRGREGPFGQRPLPEELCDQGGEAGRGQPGAEALVERAAAEDVGHDQHGRPLPGRRPDEQGR